MALEDLTGTKYIDSLNSSNPTATDPKNEGDDHIRGVKNVLKTTFPNVSGAVTATHTELNLIDGVTATTAELNILDGVTSTAAELNKNDDSAAAIANCTSGMRTYICDPAIISSVFNVTTSVTQATFESVGPTGSGATNIWTDMDNMPSGCSAILIEINADMTPSFASTTFFSRVGARPTGSAESGDPESIVFEHELYSDSVEAFTTTRQVWIALDSSNRFDIFWTAAGTSPTINILLRGFIK